MSLDRTVGRLRHTINQIRGETTPQQHSLCRYALFEAQGTTWNVAGRGLHGPSDTSEYGRISRQRKMPGPFGCEQTTRAAARQTRYDQPCQQQMRYRLDERWQTAAVTHQANEKRAAAR
jgi:hypothetical protein